MDGICWRAVEAQHRASTSKLVGTLEEQGRLEELLEAIKPPYPPELIRYHYLLFTPFRYAPYDHASRFRRRNQKEGVYYAAETVETAMAECAFYRLLFFLESPDTPIPDNPAEFKAFSVEYRTDKGLDLTMEPLARDERDWTDKEGYMTCQDLADEARTAGCDVIRYISVRCPDRGRNVALLTPLAFAASKPGEQQTWHLIIKADQVGARCEFPPQTLVFSRARLEDDPRMRGLLEQRNKA